MSPMLNVLLDLRMVGNLGRKKFRFPPQAAAETHPKRTIMALRMIYKKTMDVVAGQYGRVLGNQLSQYGEFCYYFAARLWFALCGG